MSALRRLMLRLPLYILRSPLHPLMSQRYLVLTFTGRKTHRTYTIPVAYVRAASGELLVSTASRWARNLAGAPVGLRLRGAQVAGRAEVLTEPAATEDGLGRLVAAMPSYARWAGLRRGPDGQPLAGEIARAVRDGRSVIRLTPERQPASR